MKRLYIIFESTVSKASEATGLAAGIIVFLMTILITVDVIGRKIGHSTGVAQELSGYGLVFITLMALAYTLRAGEHINIDLVTSRLPQTVQKWLKVVTSVIAVGFCIWLIWHTTGDVIDSYIGKSVSRTLLHTPMWPLQLFVPLGLSLFVLAVLSEIIRTIWPYQEK